MVLAVKTTDLCLGHAAQRWILNRVNLSIPSGIKGVLIGPAGSGKSLLLHSLFGFMPPYFSGEIQVFGQSITSQREETRNRTGLVFQNPEDQFICSTVEEELRFGPRNQGLDVEETNRRMQHLSRQLHLDPLLNLSPLALSWAEKKRLALASILISRPDLLLIDDPFSGLSNADIATVVQVLEETPGTILISSPLLPPPKNFGTHWALLEKGQLVSFAAKETFTGSSIFNTTS